MAALGLEAHLNTAFLHFYYFIREYQLVERKELEVLQVVYTRLTEADAAARTEGGYAGLVRCAVSVCVCCCCCCCFWDGEKRGMLWRNL